MRVEDVRSGLGLGDVDRLFRGPGRLGREVVQEEGVEKHCLLDSFEETERHTEKTIEGERGADQQRKREKEVR